MADAMIEARAAVKANPEAARLPKYMGEANGSDLNASYKSYCALSNVIEENPHSAAAFMGQPEYVKALRKGARINGFAIHADPDRTNQ